MTYIVNGNILLVEKNDEFKEHIINEGIKALSVLNKPIQSASLTAPPGSPDQDDFYIVAATATGAWAGKENKIAYPATDTDGTVTGWNFYEPENGNYVFVIGTGLRRFNGTAWGDFLQLKSKWAIFMATGVDTTIPLDAYATFPYIVNSLYIKTTSGSCDIDIQINGTNITSLSGLTANSSSGLTSATGTNTVAVGNRLDAVISDNSSATGLIIEANYTYA